MSRAIGIQHVQITIAPGEEASSRAFYLDLLGLVEFEDVFHAKGGFWARAGSQEVHIRVEKDIDRSRTNAHTAFLIDDLQSLKAELERRGFKIFPQPKIAGFERFHTLDPSGNRVELMQKES
jgi:catechol 2,3-dioxygenase-like lactoylglutathione lyase family enzyme